MFFDVLLCIFDILFAILLLNQSIYYFVFLFLLHFFHVYPFLLQLFFPVFQPVYKIQNNFPLLYHIFSFVHLSNLLVNAIARDADLTKAQAGKALDATVNAISEALKQGDKITIVGFGTFSVGERAARVGKNPQTGERLEIKASKVPKFKAGKLLKDSVN